VHCRIVQILRKLCVLSIFFRGSTTAIQRGRDQIGETLLDLSAFAVRFFFFGNGEIGAAFLITRTRFCFFGFL
jgi:hypothetical protein